MLASQTIYSYFRKMIKVKKTGRCRKMKKTVVVTASVRDLIINIRTKGQTFDRRKRWVNEMLRI